MCEGGPRGEFLTRADDYNNFPTTIYFNSSIDICAEYGRKENTKTCQFRTETRRKKKKEDEYKRKENIKTCQFRTETRQSASPANMFRKLIYPMVFCKKQAYIYAISPNISLHFIFRLCPTEKHNILKR